ncbi:hypothetical protein BT96DRAFT_913336, partial [Gymnopus androsaceus JB14]
MRRNAILLIFTRFSLTSPLLAPGRPFGMPRARRAGWKFHVSFVEQDARSNLSRVDGDYCLDLTGRLMSMKIFATSCYQVAN